MLITKAISGDSKKNILEKQFFLQKTKKPLVTSFLSEICNKIEKKKFFQQKTKEKCLFLSQKQKN